MIIISMVIGWPCDFHFWESHGWQDFMVGLGYSFHSSKWKNTLQKEPRTTSRWTSRFAQLAFGNIGSWKGGATGQKNKKRGWNVVFSGLYAGGVINETWKKKSWELWLPPTQKSGGQKSKHLGFGLKKIHGFLLHWFFSVRFFFSNFELPNAFTKIPGVIFS